MTPHPPNRPSASCLHTGISPVICRAGRGASDEQESRRAGSGSAVHTPPAPPSTLTLRARLPWSACGRQMLSVLSAPRRVAAASCRRHQRRPRRRRAAPACGPWLPAARGAPQSRPCRGPGWRALPPQTRATQAQTRRRAAQACRCRHRRRAAAAGCRAAAAVAAAVVISTWPCASAGGPGAPLQLHWANAAGPVARARPLASRQLLCQALQPSCSRMGLPQRAELTRVLLPGAQVRKRGRSVCPEARPRSELARGL